MDKWIIYRWLAFLRYPHKMDTQQINNSWYLKSPNNSLGGSSDLAALIMTNHDSYI